MEKELKVQKGTNGKSSLKKSLFQNLKQCHMNTILKIIK